ncbi:MULTISPECIES: DUF397 domain-containing protein [unclassified Streptomyces]|uniref:DUF397 domain-containing protein n=1 Tax=unclassified Streptomyces TaxID=2593676 RepID=UPI00344D35F3
MPATRPRPGRARSPTRSLGTRDRTWSQASRVQERSWRRHLLIVWAGRAPGTPGGRAAGRGQPGRDLIPVRDSKVQDGRVLVFGVAPWGAFVAGVKGGA